MLTPPPSHLSAQHIQRSFGRIHASYGEQAVIGGRVQLEAVTALDGDDIELSGQVHDAQRVYEVQVFYQPHDDWLFSGDCTCSAGNDCQHCAALVYAWLRLKPAPVANPLMIQSWLRALDPADTELSTPAPPRSQWVYVLHPSPQPHTLWVEVMHQQRANPQKPWRKAQSMNLQSLWPESSRAKDRVVLSTDRDIFQLLWSLQQAQQKQGKAHTLRVYLAGKSGVLALQEMVQTGRCFWQRPPGIGQQHALNWGSERTACPHWQVVPGGQQWKVRVEPVTEPLPQQSHLFLMASHSFYYDQHQRSVGFLDTSARQMRQWLNAPVIPPEALPEVTRTLIAQLPNAPIPAGADITETVLCEKPVPVLHLCSPYLTRFGFDYGEKHLAYHPKPAAQQRHLSPDKKTLYTLIRDVEREKAYYQVLIATGLMPLQTPESAFAFPSENGALNDVELVNHWHPWLHQHLPALREKGWRIHLHKAFQLEFIASPAWQGKLEPDPDTHGFDLALGVTIEGETVNLLPLLLRVLRTVPDTRQMREQLANQDTWLLPLDPEPVEAWAAKSEHKTLPQRWLEVPARRLVRILDVLIELFDDQKVRDSLPLSYFSALQLKTQLHLYPDDYGVHWEAPAELNAVIKKLSDAPQDGVAVDLPEGVQATLRPYQERGFRWLVTLAELGLNGILADDMGLGKTLQTLTLLLHYKATGQLKTPALVVMPTSVLGTWEAECRRFAPALRVLRYHGKERHKETLTGYDVILTSYTLFRHDVLLHRQTCYTWLILDEAQNIKNPRSRTALNACAQPATHRLCLTGTPIENNLENLWSLFHFLMPGFLETLERYNSRFRHPIERTQDLTRLQVLRERIAPFILRRLKQAVATELPPKTEIVRPIELGTAQRDLYETIRLSVDKEVRKAIAKNGFKQSRIFVLDALLKLRQVCGHPQLLNLPEAQKVRRSAKLEHFLELVKELRRSGRKVLVFSQFVSMLRIMERSLQQLDINYALLTGETRQRDAEIERFQSGEVSLFLISLKAGGVGLNLTAADTVIHYDPWWNPATEQQATDRSWRIGQTQPVFVYRLIAKGTLEERIVALQRQKQSLQAGLLHNTSMPLEQLELLSLLQQGL